MVTAAVVTTRPDKAGQPQLAAYFTCSEAPDTADLRSYLKEQLPAYMLPAHLVVVSEIPLTANGKVDDAALPDPEGNALGTGADFVGARNATETRLIEIFSEVLENDNIGVKDNLFDLKLDSLKVVRSFKVIEEEWPAKIEIHDIFSNPTVEKLALLLSDDTNDADEEKEIRDIEF